MAATLAPTAPAASPLDRRYDFVLLFDVVNGNPNGDPDAGNSPRVDPETGRGLVSDVCLKRKIRNFVSLATAGAEGYDIYVKERGVLNAEHQKAYDARGLKKGEKGAPDKAREWMCQRFFDVRTFGAVMSTEVNAGQVRGPVQVTFARSVDPIVSLEQAITRMAVTNERDAEKERTIGRKEIVPYGLYIAHGFISPQLAAQTGFSEGDLDLLRQALAMMFEHDRSAARGLMSTRRCWAFEHESPLGNAPAHRLFERVRVARKDPARPPREFADYDVSLDQEGLPAGVRVHDWA